MLFRSHCAAMGFSFSDFKRDIENIYRVQYISKFDLLRKTNGPPMRVNVVKISQPKEMFDRNAQEANS